MDFEGAAAPQIFFSFPFLVFSAASCDVALTPCSLLTPLHSCVQNHEAYFCARRVRKVITLPVLSEGLTYLEKGVRVEKD